MGEFMLDAYKGWTEDALKRRCREMVRANMHKDIILAILFKFGPDHLTSEDRKEVERIASQWED